MRNLEVKFKKNIFEIVVKFLNSVLIPSIELINRLDPAPISSDLSLANELLGSSRSLFLFNVINYKFKKYSSIRNINLFFAEVRCNTFFSPAVNR